MQIIKPSPKALSKAIIALKKGEVIICPTDTVYGFLADAGNNKAVQKIYKIKKRPKSKPLPIFVKDITMVKEIAEVDLKQEKLLKKYWPGKYTFVLKRKKGIKLFGIERNTVALRVPKYKFLNDLLEKMNRPLVQTSVNISNQPLLVAIEDIVAQFGKNKLIGFIIDEGSLKIPIPSKVIDVTSGKLTILR